MPLPPPFDPHNPTFFKQQAAGQPVGPPLPPEPKPLPPPHPRFELHTSGDSSTARLVDTHTGAVVLLPPELVLAGTLRYEPPLPPYHHGRGRATLSLRLDNVNVVWDAPTPPATPYSLCGVILAAPPHAAEPAHPDPQPPLEHLPADHPAG